MSLESEVRAIRLSVALSEDPDRVALKISGSAASSTLNRICPCELYIRDGQMQHTVLLNEAGNPITDLYVCADGEDFLLLAHGMTAEKLSRFFGEYAEVGADLRLEFLTSEHQFLSLNGPYAWELLSEVISTEVIGLPFLGFYRGDGFICFRAGSSGEFSYDLLIPKTSATQWRERILKSGLKFDLETAGIAALDLCALENFFFNIRKDVSGNMTPIELQLQWRISYKKTYPGSAALAARRQSSTHRVALVSSSNPLSAGARVFREGLEIGCLIHTGYSDTLGKWLALALLEKEWACSGIVFDLHVADKMVGQVTALSAPAINNRSVFVDPQRHSYSTRAGNTFPPLIHSPHR